MGTAPSFVESGGAPNFTTFNSSTLMEASLILDTPPAKESHLLLHF